MKTQLVRHSTNYRNNVHEIITRVWLAELVYSHITWVQITNSARAVKIYVCLDSLWRFFIYIINK